MSTERELAQLVAHPWSEYRQGNNTYYGAKCQVAYAEKVNQLAAICDLHRRTPLTKEILELNAVGSDNLVGGYRLDSEAHCVFAEANDEFEYCAYDFSEGVWTDVFRLRTVADLDNLLDLIGIDKQIKLPNPHDEQ